ncbi:hypothetical protein D3C73_1451540 [compost metagenome]
MHLGVKIILSFSNKRIDVGCLCDIIGTYDPIKVVTFRANHLSVSPLSNSQTGATHDSNVEVVPEAVQSG